MPRLILASSSPRRQGLLKSLVRIYSVATSAAEEEGSEAAPDIEFTHLPLPAPFHIPSESDPRVWAWRKGADVACSCPDETSDDVIVLAADTVVVAPGELLNKPKDDADAVRMLSLLRDRKHYVVTGFVLLRPHERRPETLHSEAVITRVFMRLFSESELEGYVATHEHVDKAGAYALQGLGGKLIERVDGCVTNVIGLPLCRVRAALLRAGVEVERLSSEGYCAFCKAGATLD